MRSRASKPKHGRFSFSELVIAVEYLESTSGSTWFWGVGLGFGGMCLSEYRDTKKSINGICFRSCAAGDAAGGEGPGDVETVAPKDHAALRVATGAVKTFDDRPIFSQNLAIRIHV